MQEQGLAASPLPAAELPPWAQSPCEATVGFPAWADDFAHLQNAAAVCEILPRVQRSTQLIQERATSIGMVLTYATDKTAVMLPPGHDWTIHGAQEELDPPGLYVPVQDSLQQRVHKLPIVHA